mgnify:CR=1 FL=1
MRALAMDRTNQIALYELARIRYEAQDYATANKYYVDSNKHKYYDTYRTVVRKQSAAGLLLGIQLAKAEGDRDSEASYALALRNLYPNSAEYQAYKRTVKR